MKKLVQLLFIFGSIQLLIAQPSIEWQKSIGSSRTDRANSIVQTSDGGYIFAGECGKNDSDVISFHGGLSDCWVVKFDNLGLVQWQHSYGGSKYDRATGIQQTLDGGYIMIGVSESDDGDITSNHGGNDCWVIKTDSNGVMEWQTSIGGSLSDFGEKIYQTVDGGFIIAAYSNSIDGDRTPHSGNSDYWIVKLGNLGNIEWEKSFGGSANDYAFDIKQCFDHGYIICGHSRSSDGDVSMNHGLTDCWVIKIDSIGQLQWERALGGSGTDEGISIIQTSDSGFVVCGPTASTNGDVTSYHTGPGDMCIYKLNSSGLILWQKGIGGTSVEIARSIEQTSDGGFIIVGSSDSNDGDVTGNHSMLSDLLIVKLNSNGSIIWQDCLGGALYEDGNSIHQTNDGGFIIAGIAVSSDGDLTQNQGQSDAWIIKLSATTNLNELQHSEFDFQIFPNPFSSEMTLSYDLSSGSNTQIQISDPRGKLIKRLFLDSTLNGKNYSTWDGTNNAGEKVENGIYFISMLTNKHSKTKKVLLLSN